MNKIIIGILASLLLAGVAIAARSDYSDCKVIAHVGFQTIYSCPDGLVYMVEDK